MARRITASRLGQPLESLGEFIGAQRRQAGVSLRQLAETAGVSNPYLSQIERGLRRPSAEVLQQLATALRVSAETLYVRAGIIDPQEHRSPGSGAEVVSVPSAVLADRWLSGRQKQIILDVYDSFVGVQTQAGEPGRPAESATPTTTYAQE